MTKIGNDPEQVRQWQRYGFYDSAPLWRPQTADWKCEPV